MKQKELTKSVQSQWLFSNLCSVFIVMRYFSSVHECVFSPGSGFTPASPEISWHWDDFAPATHEISRPRR